MFNPAILNAWLLLYFGKRNASHFLNLTTDAKNDILLSLHPLYCNAKN